MSCHFTLPLASGVRDKPLHLKHLIYDTVELGECLFTKCQKVNEIKSNCKRMQLRHKYEWTGNLCRYALKLFSSHVTCFNAWHLHFHVSDSWVQQAHFLALLRTSVCSAGSQQSPSAVVDSPESPTRLFVRIQKPLWLSFLMAFAFLLLHNQCNCCMYWMETRQGQLDYQETT